MSAQGTLTATATVPAGVEGVLTLGRKGDAFRFITAGSLMLRSCPDHDELRLLLVRHLAQNGLLYRAAAYARGFSGPLRNVPDVLRMRQNLEAAENTGLVSWEEHRARFEANIEALRARCESVDELVEVWEAARPAYELHQTRDGHFQVFQRIDGEHGEWRPAFANHQPDGTAEELARRFEHRVLPPLCVENVGLGYHIAWLYGATRDTFLGATPPLFLIEPSREALAVTLHLHDWQDLLRDDRVRVFTGPTATQDLEEAAVEDDCHLPPIAALRCLPHDPRRRTEVGPALQRVAVRTDEQTESLRREVEQPYAGRDRAWWARRYEAALSGTSRPLHVLGITSRFTTVLKYSMRDALHGLAMNGCATRMLIEGSNHARLTPRTMLKAIAKFQPDLVLIIDHTRAGQQAGLVKNLPVMTWVQDRLPKLFCRETGESLGPLDFCMGLGREELVRDHGYPASRFMDCEMATSPDVLGSIEENLRTAGEAEDPQFACDVAFATTHSRPPEALVEECCAHSPPAEPLLRAAFAELQRRAACNELNPGLDATLFLERFVRDNGFDVSAEERDRFARSVVRPIVDQLIRHQTIGWVADWAEQTGGRFYLYGNGWDQHPRFGKFARGFVQHGPDLGRAFRGAKVNLHAGCLRAFHQRVLDVLAAGGTMLLRYNAEDFAGGVVRAVLEQIRDRNLKPGDTVSCCDLDERVQALWRQVQPLRGRDVDSSVVVEEHLLTRLAWLDDPEYLRSPADVWPDLRSVTFDSREELFEQLHRLLGDDELRRRTAADMRTRMLERFSYTALMRRMTTWLARALQTA